MVRSNVKFAIWLGVAVLSAVAIAGCKEKPQNGGQKTEDKTQIAQDNPPPALRSPQGEAGSSEPATTKPALQPTSNPRPTLNSIIARRRGWGPAYTNWYGKEAPDFTVTDITGKQHKLSDYRGRNVMLIFWATWCRPCIMEIPHLIELRNTIGEDKLAILAISHIEPMSSTETVKKFVALNPVINYTVISTDIMAMPEPYNLVNSIPSSFFIDPQGKIKLATEGVVPLPDIKAIIEAER
jgi:peroxiredoxin